MDPNKEPQGRESIMRQKRPILEDTPFEDDDDDLQSSTSVFLREKLKMDDERLSTRGDPQDKHEKESQKSSIKPDPLNKQPETTLGASQIKPTSLGGQQKTSSRAPIIAQGNPFAAPSNSSRMTIASQPASNFFTETNDGNSGRMSISQNDKTIFDMVTSDNKLKEEPEEKKVVVTKLEIDKHQFDGEKDSKESTPEFKWGSQAASATLPNNRKISNDESIFKQLEKVESQKQNNHSKDQIQELIPTSQQHKIDNIPQKIRESAELKITPHPQLIDREVIQQVAHHDPTQDELQAEDDPSNYLTLLENPQHHEESSKEGAQTQQQVAHEMPQDHKDGYLADDGYNSDESFSKEFYLSMHDEIIHPEKQTSSSKKREVDENGLIIDEQGYKNIMKIIDWNERRHQYVAKHKLQQHSELSTALQLQDQNLDQGGSKLRIMTSMQVLNSITKKLDREKQYSNLRSTALAINDDLLFIGNSEGQVWMFSAKNEEEYQTFSDKSKDFLGNSVTAIDVHPLRTEYVVIGYERGQLVLFETLEPKKSIKSIKDHHSAQIVDLKFCDWMGGKFHDTHSEDLQMGGGASASSIPQDDPKAWMFISIDATGKVVINSVSKKLIMMVASKYIVIDPAKNMTPQLQTKFTSVACRFKSQIIGIYDDQSIIALGSNDRVLIGEAKPSDFKIFLSLNAPQPLPKDNVVALSWGRGMTPKHMDRPHSLLAVCWGPLIQIVVLIDHDDVDKPLVLDGFYVLKNIKTSVTAIQQQPMNQADFRKQLENKVHIEQVEEEKKSSDKANNNQKNKIPPLDQAMKKPELSIECVQFISDSTLIVATSSADVRIVHTHSFIPGQYDPNTYYNNETQDAAFEQYYKSEADLESGLGKVQNLLRSDFSKTYAHSIRFFEGRLAVLTQKNVQMCNHLTWQQSIQEFKRQVHDDLIQVFSRAISIYKGKVKGYRGLQDNAFLRENFIKAELKLLVKEIIQQVVEKTKQEAERLAAETLNQAKPLMDKEGDESKEQIKATLLKLDQFEDEKRKKFETLIRIAIEFCVELRDSDFLFHDLFWLFQEEKIEKFFVQELEPFIMAGRLKDWELPNEVIQNHVIKYYKDPKRADALEKIIINLNLKKCPQQIIFEFQHFADTNYLTTAILFLNTSVLEKKDNSSCFTVLCQLFALYKKASKDNKLSQFSFNQTPNGSLSPNTPTDGNQQFIDITQLKETSYDSQEKQKIEKSFTYLGYKLLWVLHLFINGKKFPQGQIKEKMWRAYIHDIIEFLSNQEYLKILLSIDAETVFQVISILFQPTSKNSPFELVKAGREEDEKMMQIQGAADNHSMENNPHWRFMKVLDSYCIRPDTPENVKFQYYYFFSKIIARSPAFEGFDQQCFFFVTKELLGNYRKYIDFVKKLYDQYIRARLIHQAQLLGEPIDEVTLHYNPNSREKHRDRERVIRKVERDLINLIRKCEPLQPMDMQIIVNLAQNTNLNQVKTALLEKKEQYLESLRMLLGVNPQTGNTSQPQQQQQMQTAEQKNTLQNSMYVIQWIDEKLQLLESKTLAPDANQQTKNTYDYFKREVTQHYKTIVAINVDAAIKLVKDRLNDNHKDIIDQLSRDPAEQLAYMDRLLELQGNDIQSTIQGYIQDSTNGVEAKRWLDILKLHLKLTCQIKPNKVIEVIENRVIARNSCYPIEDCLQICLDNKQLEAVFLLSKKLSKYFDSINQGVNILQEKVDYGKLLIELYYCKQHNIPTSPFTLPKSKKAMAAAIRTAADEAVENQQKMKTATEEAKRQASELASKAISVTGLLSKGGRLISQAASKIHTNESGVMKQYQEDIKQVKAQSVAHNLELPPQIKLFDKIYGRMLKICQNHSKEVDQKQENAIWFMVVDILIAKLRPLALKKRFAREYFEDRFYVFIETYVKVHRDGFHRLLDYLIQKQSMTAGHQGGNQQQLVFQDMREVILKMFGDQRLERIILNNANNSIKNVNSDIFQQFSQQTRFGILSRQRNCGICKHFADSFLYDDHHSVLHINEDQKSEYFETAQSMGSEGLRLKVFACRHIFHMGCLKTYYLKKLSGVNDSKTEIEKMFKSYPEKLRCITCNLKNLEIGDEESKSQVKKAGFQAAQQSQTSKTTQGKSGKGDDSMNKDDDEEELDEQSLYARRVAHAEEMRHKTIMSKQLNRLQRQMDYFDKQQGSEGFLTINDFRSR